ncbi:MAG: MerR family transcriptional regulator [Aerococcus sp.]|nr:MerR family transcriptional regulator [Aerococcus sp.]
MATIGEVSKQFQLPISTLRYYDKEGLFPDLKRSGGQRQFSEKEMETLRVIDCLKQSGLEIKDIKHFIALCQGGQNTYQERLALLERQQQIMSQEIKKMKRAQDMLTFKCWYYQQALALGNETDIQLANMPDSIQKAYQNAHQAVEN